MNQNFNKLEIYIYLLDKAELTFNNPEELCVLIQKEFNDTIELGEIIDYFSFFYFEEIEQSKKIEIYGYMEHKQEVFT